MSYHNKYLPQLHCLQFSPHNSHPEKSNVNTKRLLLSHSEQSSLYYSIERASILIVFKSIYLFDQLIVS